ncbi:hypothetical protein ACSSVZ_005607 [Amorphus sp. MBR-141]
MLQKGNRWTTFTPPEARLSRRYRGRILHRRFQVLQAQHFAVVLA